MSLIELANVSVDFDQKGKTVQAVHDVSLIVESGDVYGIVGYSGAGKSTLVRTVNLLQRPTAGSVKVNGQQLIKDGEQVISHGALQLARRKIGMIFQGFNLLNETSVLENVAFALKHSKLSEDEIEAKSRKLLSLVELADKADFYPAQLSGGQQQRVAIARALANDPNILISDEATSALDPQTTQQILQLLQKLNRELGLTIILITHEMAAVKAIATKIAVMENGRLIEHGRLTDVYLHPKQSLTKQFVGGSLAAMKVLNQLHLAKLAPDEAICQLVYNMSNVTHSIIIDLYREVGVVASMLYGNVELLGDQPVGTLMVLLKGDATKQRAALAFLAAHQVTATVIPESEVNYA